MSRRSNIQTLIIKQSRILQKLKERQVTEGIHTPPHILIEIEDIETKIEKLEATLESLPVETVDEAAPHEGSNDPYSSEESGHNAIHLSDSTVKGHFGRLSGQVTQLVQ